MKTSALDNNEYLVNIEEQALSYLRTWAPLAFPGIMCSLSIICYLIYLRTHSPYPVYWLISVAIIQTGSYYYRRNLPDKPIAHQAKLNQGIFINVLDGIIISSCLIFMPYIDDLTRMVIINALTIACTGATITTVGYRPFYLGFSVPIMLSLIISSALSAYLWGGSEYLYFISLFSLLISGVLLVVSMGIFNNFKTAFIANLRNIQINKELRIAVDEAKKANQSKTRFLASASHDLRQPMTTLSLFIATMSLKELDPEQEEIIGHMSTAIGSIDAQLDSLLDISKLDAGIIKVNKASHDIAMFTSKLINQYNEQQDSDAIPIRFFSKLKHAIVDTDITLFERVLRNLIGNAIKYTPNGYIDIHITHTSDSLTITISDTGIGISHENLEYIFDEFYQADNPERDESRGLGLGLSIVKRMCDLLNMKIDVKSEEGIGTDAALSIVCNSFRQLDNINTEAPSNVITPTHGPAKTIIALDNEVNILNALRAVLESMGHHVITFSDAKRALLAFTEQEFDMALIDYRLPGKLNGLDVINEMQRINSNTKCFLVTGDSNVGDKADNYNIIYKPVTDKKLAFLFN